jgi:hypothetical protein
MRDPMVLTHKFVEFIPPELEANTIYISIPYATVIHNCCCGCGNRIVTPLSPAEWKLIFDGRTISLEPSIGNWRYPCRSHYWIRNNRVIWSDDWSDDEIMANKKRDDQAAAAFYGKGTQKPKLRLATSSKKSAAKKKMGGLKSKIKKWFSDDSAADKAHD